MMATRYRYIGLVSGIQHHFLLLNKSYVPQNTPNQKDKGSEALEHSIHRYNYEAIGLS